MTSTEAEQLIAELLQRGASKVDQAAVYHLKVQLHILKSENPQAVDSALACLRLFGIDLPAHPTWEQVQAEYETVWQILDGRPIENLIDLPLMTDPELLAAMQRAVGPCSLPPTLPIFHLFCLVQCRMVNVSMRARRERRFRARLFLSRVQSSDRSFTVTARAFVSPSSHCDLVEKHGFIAYRAKVYDAMGMAALLDAADRNLDRFHAGGLSHCD